ncbi:uncharacterized protein FPOAC1_013816 [Fusarium poae]|uniref:uncharacterized protein n=1 Tax=Fusarium poae TaxID=36050 RepID=UPI001D03F9E9|nr:uncharacterized protein FPOAC1_013816 [Fusarium poae]KAG8664477.1 hypothetical protein FPOAC1_013816 [Fusarium poae]
MTTFTAETIQNSWPPKEAQKSIIHVSSHAAKKRVVRSMFKYWLLRRSRMSHCCTIYVRSQATMNVRGLAHKQNVRPPPILRSIFLRRSNSQKHHHQQDRALETGADRGHGPQAAGKTMDANSWFERMDIDQEEAPRDTEMVIPTIVIHPPSGDDCDMQEETMDVEMVCTEDESQL